MDFHSRNQSFYVLVATASLSDQQLIAKSLQKQMPSVRLITTTTLEQILEYLQTSQMEIYNFPRLLILGLELAGRSVVWAFLQQLKDTYPRLPIIVTSLDQQDQTVLQAYNLGVRSYTVKAETWEEWEEQVNTLAHYWFTVSTLPSSPPL